MLDEMDDGVESPNVAKELRLGGQMRNLGYVSVVVTRLVGLSKYRRLALAAVASSWGFLDLLKRGRNKV